MRIDYKHNLTKQQSYEKINKLLPELQAQYADKISNPKWSWNSDNSKMDFSMEIMGFDVSGNIDVMDGKDRRYDNSKAQRDSGLTIRFPSILLKSPKSLFEEESRIGLQEISI